MNPFKPSYKLSQKEDHFILEVTPPAIISLQKTEVKMTQDQATRFLQWYNGQGLIQDCLPELSPTEREQILTGISPEEQSKLFKQ